jgi:hypothetical protein
MAIAATRIFRSSRIQYICDFIHLRCSRYTYIKICLYFQQIARLLMIMCVITSPIAILRETVDTKDDFFGISCAFVSTDSVRMAGIIVGEVIITRVNHEIYSSRKYILTYMQIYYIPPHVSHKLQHSDRTVM